MTVRFFLPFFDQLQKQQVLLTSAKLEASEECVIPDGGAPLN